MRGNSYTHDERWSERIFMFYSAQLEYLNLWVLFLLIGWRWKSVLMLEAFALHVWVINLNFPSSPRASKNSRRKILLHFSAFWYLLHIVSLLAVIIPSFIADFCNFLSLFFIKNCFFEIPRDFLSLLEAIAREINWKKIFWMGAAGMHLREGNFIVIVLNIMLSFRKKSREMKKKKLKKLNEFSADIMR